MSIRTVALGALLLVFKAAASGDDSYAPYYVDCPADLQLVRQPAGLSEPETAWVQGRRRAVADAIVPYLERLNLTDFDTQAYIAKIHENPEANVPVIAFAVSGGGWRSAYTGAGGLRALDESTPGANHAKIGGLYQSLTYLAGLSGGSWPVASSAFQQYAPFDEQVANWHTNISRTGADTYSEYAVPAEGYFKQIAPKAEAGFNVSAADWFGRTFAYEFVPGVNNTWSSIADLPAFKNFAGPMPMLQCSSVNTSSITESGIYYPTLKSTMYEWTPFEFGSWDVGFVPTQYVGTVPGPNNTAEKCVQNYDQASFVLGSAAAAYNAWWLEAISNGTEGTFSKRSLAKRQNSLSESTLAGLNKEFAQIFNLTLDQIVNPSIPNPFGGAENITLADNSEAGQALPLVSLIQPSRKTDFIMAWDDDGDDAPYSWINGTNIYDTYLYAKAAGLPFPEVPPVATILARNYTLHPVLFGCNASRTTTGDDRSPIVASLSNSPWTYYSNYSWFAAEYSSTLVDGVLDNSFQIMTGGNLTVAPDWTTCLGCAAIDRSLSRVGMARSDQCEECFERYCWDGTTSELEADFVLDPALIMDPGLGFEAWNKTHGSD